MRKRVIGTLLTICIALLPGLAWAPPRGGVGIGFPTWQVFADGWMRPFNAGNGIAINGTGSGAPAYIDSTGAIKGASIQAGSDTPITSFTGSGLAISGGVLKFNGNFSDLAGSATDAQIPDDITASSYLPLSGGTMTGALNMGAYGITNTGDLTGVTDIVTKGPWVDVRAYASFAAAISAIGSTETTLMIPNGQSVAASITIPANVELMFLQNGSLAMDTGVAVDFSGPINAGYHQIFSGSGTVTFNDGNIGYVYPQWWGAKGDGTQDDQPAIQLAINALQPSYKGGGIFFPRGTYNLGNTLSISNVRKLRLTGLSGNGGTGPSSVLQWTGAANGTVISVLNSRDSTLEYLSIPAGTTTIGVAVDIDGATGVGETATHTSLEHVTIGASNIGVRLSSVSTANNDLNMFSDVTIAGAGSYGYYINNGQSKWNKIIDGTVGSRTYGIYNNKGSFVSERTNFTYNTHDIELVSPSDPILIVAPQSEGAEKFLNNSAATSAQWAVTILGGRLHPAGLGTDNQYITYKDRGPLNLIGIDFAGGTYNIDWKIKVDGTAPAALNAIGCAFPNQSPFDLTGDVRLHSTGNTGTLSGGGAGVLENIDETLKFYSQTAEAFTTEGTVAYADSTNWNPGIITRGDGLHVYTGSAWEAILQSGDIGVDVGDFMKDGSVAATGAFNLGGYGLTNAGPISGATTGDFSSTINFPSGIIQADGDVGIGITTASSPLHIINDGYEGIRIQRSGEATQYLSLNEGGNVAHTIQGFGSKEMRIRNNDTTTGIMFYVNTSTMAMNLDVNGKVGINQTIPGAMLQIDANASTTKGLIVKGAAAQTANALEIQASAGTVLVAVDASGNITTVGNINSQGTLDVAGTATLAGPVVMSGQHPLTAAQITAAPSTADGLPKIAYADSTNWNPGSGAGWYGYDPVDDAWAKFY